MFGLVKKNKDIEQLLRILEMDAANNYKDAVQEDIKRNRDRDSFSGIYRETEGESEKTL